MHIHKYLYICVCAGVVLARNFSSELFSIMDQGYICEVGMYVHG